MKIARIRKVLLWILVPGLLFLGGGYVGYRAYKSARQVHLIKQARDYLAKPDVKKALLCLQRAIRYNPKDVEACRLMAQLTEAGRSPSALLWRSRVVELSPHSLEDRLSLAQTAIMMRDYTVATNALAGADADARKTARYHNVAGAVASAVGNATEAEEHFLEAARLDPDNPVQQLNLAVVRLHGTNDTSLGQARASLQRLSSNQTNAVLRCQSIRELVIDAMRFRNTNAALALSSQLLEQTNAAFSDRLMRLDVLLATTNSEFRPALATAQTEAGDDLRKVSEIAVWQMMKTTPAETLAWLQMRPMSVQTNQSLALLAAECQTAMQDWRGLQTSLGQQNWAELEFVRHAFLARSLRGQDLRGAADGEWGQASEAAKRQLGSAIMLLRYAAQWNWVNEGEALLWTIINQYPDQKWAVQALNQVLFATGSTRPLMKLYSQEVRRSPSNLPYKNNLAMTALLLDAQEFKPHDLAREVYEKAPTNSAYVSTYAFSLYLQDKHADAIKTLERLKPNELEDPAIAGYYGMMLKASGDGARAKKYLDLSSKARLLPEERKLIEKAKAGI